MTQRPRTGAERVGEILGQALERPAPEREAFVAGLCAADERLRTEVTSLLRALGRVGHLLEPEIPDSPPAQAPAPDLDGLLVGPYRIGQRIGAGGMGVVYAGEDTRLGRAVAVKSLPPELSLNLGRREMLEQEARVLAALTHQNIGAIHGIEDSPHGPILVLEYVDGPTLAERLARGPLPIDEVRPIARQVLLALEAAHSAGVVHRDIKPSNVKITQTGQVKVLDFGIARLAAQGSPVPESGLSPVTAPGRPIGTPSYMSPEQARGRPVDQRTDLWAFGCVLYEMLTGAQAFRGETATDTIAAILRAEPDWSRLPKGMSEPELRLLRRCLEKDPDRRLRDAGDARLEIDAGESEVPGPRQQARGRNRAPATILAALGVLGLGAWLGWGWRGPRPDRSNSGATTRMTIDVPAGLDADIPGGCLAISRDGRALAFVAGKPPAARLFVRRLEEFEATELPGTAGAACPSFSPDGKWIAYGQGTAAWEIRKVRVSGGAPVTLTAGAYGRSGICWGPDDSIIYTGEPNTCLWRIPASGGEPTSLTQPEPGRREINHSQPEVLPN